MKQAHQLSDIRRDDATQRPYRIEEWKIFWKIHRSDGRICLRQGPCTLIIIWILPTHVFIFIY